MHVLCTNTAYINTHLHTTTTKTLFNFSIYLFSASFGLIFTHIIILDLQRLLPRGSELRTLFFAIPVDSRRYLSKQPYDRRSAVRGFVCTAAGCTPPSPTLVCRDVPSWPSAQGADLHGLVRRWVSALPLRFVCDDTPSSRTSARTAISRAVLLPRRSSLPAARGARPQRHTRTTVRVGC